MSLTEVVRTVPGSETEPRWDQLRVATWLSAAAAVVGWLPFVHSATSPDEGGFLLVASQWGRGSSLYGQYWVDRPPLLIAIHEVAAALGGTTALRFIGIAGVVASVFLTSAIVRASTSSARTAPSLVARAAPAVLCAIFLTTPLFGTMQVDGELLSVPFVLAGILGYVRASSADSRASAVRWAVVAGAAAVAAALVKQNAVDVVVFALAVLLVRTLAGDRRNALRVAGVAAASAALTLAAALGLSALRGTGPLGLWDAVGTFRFQAASVISRYATAATPHRLSALIAAAVASLAPLVILVLASQLRGAPAAVHGGRRSAPDLRWPALAMLAWEVFAIAGGGSFWLHYLLVLVPGMVVLACAAAQRPLPGRRWVAAAVAAAAVSAAISVGGAATLVGRTTSDDRVVGYLRDHAVGNDTVVVAFGHPNIVWDAHMTSPYAELWSLPVRVRDSHLVGLTNVLTGPRAPRWVVVAGTSLYTWGVHPGVADRALRAHYDAVAHLGHYYVWERR